MTGSALIDSFKERLLEDDDPHLIVYGPDRRIVLALVEVAKAARPWARNGTTLALALDALDTALKEQTT